MGHSPAKKLFSESPSSETTGPIEKIKECKNSTDILYVMQILAEILRCAAA